MNMLIISNRLMKSMRNQINILKMCKFSKVIELGVLLVTIITTFRTSMTLRRFSLLLQNKRNFTMNLLSKALQENHILNIGNRDPTSNGKVKTMMIFIFQTLESTKHTWLIDRFIQEIQIFNMKSMMMNQWTILLMNHMMMNYMMVK